MSDPVKTYRLPVSIRDDDFAELVTDLAEELSGDYWGDSAGEVFAITYQTKASITVYQI